MLLYRAVCPSYRTVDCGSDGPCGRCYEIGEQEASDQGLSTLALPFPEIFPLTFLPLAAIIGFRLCESLHRILESIIR